MTLIAELYCWAGAGWESGDLHGPLSGLQIAPPASQHVSLTAKVHNTLNNGTRSRSVVPNYGLFFRSSPYSPVPSLIYLFSTG